MPGPRRKWTSLFGYPAMKLLFLHKSPYVLPSDQYGGGRKRLFLGLLSGSCLLLGCVLALFLVLPWVLPGEQLRWLGLISLAAGVLLIAVLFWLCLTLIFHIYTARLFPGVSVVRHVTIRLLFPLMELLAKAVRVDRSRVRRSFIKVNNEFVLARGLQTTPDHVLLLLPHCIQRSVCPHRLTHTLELCRRCGACPVGPLLDLRDKYGFGMAIATGGTIARRIVIERRPRLIVAVACERDLTSGIQDSYPLPVFGILNERPCGPCLDTRVPLRRVEAVVRHFLGFPAEDASTGPFRRRGAAP